MNENVNIINHELKIVDRNLLTLTGVSKIVSFDSSEFILESNMGPIHLRGEGLELLSLDNKDGIIKIKGKVIGFSYLEKLTKNKEESIIAKLFK